MKMSPELAKAEANMQPGVISQAGFLGDDARPLVDIIEADEERVGALGLEFPAVVERLRHFLDEGKKGLGEPTTVEADWRVQLYEARGHMACPWEDGIFRKVNAQLTHIGSGKTLLYSELSLHLIDKHHFFQGRGSPFRVEPDDLKQVLGL